MSQALLAVQNILTKDFILLLFSNYCWTNIRFVAVKQLVKNAWLFFLLALAKLRFKSLLQIKPRKKQIQNIKTLPLNIYIHTYLFEVI